MSAPPAVLWIGVGRPEERRFRLWLPLFILWPLMLALWILGLLAGAVADFVAYLVGARFKQYTLLTFECFRIIAALNGLEIHIDDDRNKIDLSLR